MNRREFTATAALAMLSGVAITITGCGGSTTGGPTTPTLVPGGVAGSISANHGHSAVVTQAQMTSGNAVLLDIRGVADHTHTLAVSQSQLAAIATSQRVAVDATTEQAHTHTVTFS